MSNPIQADEETAAMARLIAKRFVQRKDAKAIQVRDGGYRPVREPWKMVDFIQHLTKERTFGHYTCDADGMTKLITFDLDLEKDGTWLEQPTGEELADVQNEHEFYEKCTVHESHPRSDWLNRTHPGRPWYKYQLRTLADALTAGVQRQLELPTFAAYSGHKGCHVYGFFDEPVPGEVAKEAALAVLDFAGGTLFAGGTFSPHKGKNFYKIGSEDPYYDLSNITVELFPKQVSMEDKDLGNLVRLPLGLNHKGTTQLPSGKASQQPTFLIDQTRAQTELVPHPNPLWLMQNGTPFKEMPSV